MAFTLHEIKQCPGFFWNTRYLDLLTSLQVNYAIHQGVARSESERLPLFISTGSFIGRVIVGKVSGFRKVSRITLYQITFLMQCLTTTLCTLATNTASMVTYSLVFGVFDGAFACLLAIVVDDVFLDKSQAMKAIGQLFQMLAFPYAFGAPFAGKFVW